jgi:3-oxoadipate enol-lactonase
MMADRHPRTLPRVPIDHDEHPVAWREDGPHDGDLVALLHGLGGSRTAWEPQLASLATAGWRAAAWDMPGYGVSDPPASWTFEALADAAATWISRLGGRAHVVGLSLGGMIALHVALRHPHVVRSLVVCSSSPAFGFDGTTDAAAWVADRLAALRGAGSPAAVAPALLRSIMAPDATGIDAAVAAMARIDGEALAGAIGCLPTHDVVGRLGDITVPTLVVVGELDEETPRSYSEHLATHIQRARFEVVAGAGHICNLERPEAFDSLLLAFLADLAA